MKKFSSKGEDRERMQFSKLFEDCPIPTEELLRNPGLFTNRQALSRMLFMHELYLKQIDNHGVIMDFGTRWGQNMALFESFRGIYEPYNHNRKLIGFDTFEGFTAIHENDAKQKKGEFGVTKGYEKYLEKLLAYHESESPISHVKKFELHKGDAIEKLAGYLEAHPETIVSMAYFDFDLYEPTRECLNLIKDHICKGTVLGFDELNVASHPGETVAFKEELELKNHQIRHSQFSSVYSYIVI